MTTECYAQVRGSAIRVTGLDQCGDVPSPVPYATSKSVARVRINEITENGRNELMRTDEDEPRLLFRQSMQTIKHTVDIEFIRVDPGVLGLITSVTPEGDDPVSGFDAIPRSPMTSFALEVWSNLGDRKCVDGEKQWGYTLLPFLRGGRVSGFRFDNGLVSFNLTGAQTRRSPGWGVGPHDLEGAFQRLREPVSRNTQFKNYIATAPPPVEMNGVQTHDDVIDNGTASDPMPIPDDPVTVDGGTATNSGPWIIDGGTV